MLWGPFDPPQLSVLGLSELLSERSAANLVSVVLAEQAPFFLANAASGLLMGDLSPPS